VLHVGHAAQHLHVDADQPVPHAAAAATGAVLAEATLCVLQPASKRKPIGQHRKLTSIVSGTLDTTWWKIRSLLLISQLLSQTRDRAMKASPTRRLAVALLQRVLERAALRKVEAVAWNQPA